MASVNRVKYGTHFVTWIGPGGDELRKDFDSAREAKRFAKTVPRGNTDQELGEGPVRWEVTYRNSSNKGRSKRFAKKSEADRFANNVETDKHRGSYVDINAGRVTFQEYADQWLAGRILAATTREQMESRFSHHVYPVIGELPLNKITPEVIAQWTATLTHLAPRTRQIIVANVSSAFTSAVDNGRISKDPTKASSLKANKPRIPHERVVPWTVKQVADVHEQLPERYKALAFLGAGVGLRQGEVFGLATTDIDLARDVVTVRRQVVIAQSKLWFAPPKYGKEREVPLPDTVHEMIAAYLEKFPAREVTLTWRDDAGRGTKQKPGSEVTVPLIVTSREGRALNRNYINDYVWKAAVDKAGMSTVRSDRNGSHALRHHYASVLLDAGESVLAVSHNLGHADPGFTLRVYTHLMDTKGERTKSAIDAAFKAHLAT